MNVGWLVRSTVGALLPGVTLVGGCVHIASIHERLIYSGCFIYSLCFTFVSLWTGSFMVQFQVIYFPSPSFSFGTFRYLAPIQFLA